MWLHYLLKRSSRKKNAEVAKPYFQNKTAGRKNLPAVFGFQIFSGRR
jgi:hypothetical protein